MLKQQKKDYFAWPTAFCNIHKIYMQTLGLLQHVQKLWIKYCFWKYVKLSQSAQQCANTQHSTTVAINLVDFKLEQQFTTKTS